MKNLVAELRSAVMVTVMLVIVCCGVYPLIVFGVAQTVFPGKANGSLLKDSAGVIRGSRLIGQSFTGETYFHSRPSAAGFGYDATNSGGSNLGPTSARLAAILKQRIADYRAQNNLEPMNRFPPMPSPLPAAGWTRTSVFVTPSCRRNAWPRLGSSRWKRCFHWFAKTPIRPRSMFSANPA